MACICHGAKGIAIVPPRPSRLVLKSFYLLMCVGFVRFPQSKVSTRLLAAELPSNDVDCPSSLAPPKSKGCCCLCSEKRFKEWVRAHFHQFLCSFSVYLFSQCCYMSFLCRTWFWLKPLKLRDSTCRLWPLTKMPIQMFLIMAVAAQVSPAMFYWRSGNLFDQEISRSE